jgi:hypothetical protein
VARDEKRNTAAYRLVDVSSIPSEHYDEVIEDASTGGGLYGLRIVEVVYNGPAQQPIYGVYKEDEEKWKEAQSDFGFTDPGKSDETKISQDASAKAAADAEAKRKAEEAELEEIGKGAGTNPPAAGQKGTPQPQTAPPPPPPPQAQPTQPPATKK